jgi:DMSO reductase anchor subunit
LAELGGTGASEPRFCCLATTILAYIQIAAPVVLVQRETACQWRDTYPHGGTCMRFLSFAYRFVTDFAFLAAVYFSLNYIEKYNEKATLAILVLAYTGMRSVSAVRSFFFYQRIERFEVEARRLVSLITEGGANSPLKKQTINDVSLLRRDNELKSYMDLFFLALVVLLCVAKIVTG